MPHAEIGRSWKRFFRFGIGTLLIVVTAFGVWLGYIVHQATVLRVATAILMKAGGTVHFRHEAHRWPLPHTEFSSSLTFDVNREPSGPRWLRRWLGEEYFQEIVM